MGLCKVNKIKFPRYNLSEDEKEFQVRMKGRTISEIAIYLYEKYSMNGPLERSKDFEKELGYAKNIVLYDRLPKLKEDIKQTLYWLRDKTQKRIKPKGKEFAKNNLEKLKLIEEYYNDYIEKEPECPKKTNLDCERLEEIITNDKDPRVDSFRKKELLITHIELPCKKHIPSGIFIKEIKNPKRFGEKLARKYIEHKRAQSGKYKNKVPNSHSLNEILREDYFKINDLMGIQLVYCSCEEGECTRIKDKIACSKDFKKWEIKDFFENPKGKFDGAIKIVVQPNPKVEGFFNGEERNEYFEIQVTDCKNLIKGEVGEHCHATIYETRQNQFERDLTKKEKGIYNEIRKIGEELITPYWNYIMKEKG